jgi:hypothetical protein
MACYWGWSCQFVLVGSTVWLPYLLQLFLLIIIITQRENVLVSINIKVCLLLTFTGPLIKREELVMKNHKVRT